MYVKPANGLRVPDPYMGDELPEQGREVEANQYWMRRIADGEVIEASPAELKAKIKKENE